MYSSKLARLHNASTAREQGAALMVGMVLIFILSILGLTSMRSSTLEHRLVGNTLEKELTFQIADSAGEKSLGDEANLIDVVCTNQPVETEITDISNNDAIEAHATVTFGGRTPAVGYSLDANLADYRFTTTGTGSLTNSSTTTSVTQGVLILGARSDNGSC